MLQYDNTLSHFFRVIGFSHFFSTYFGRENPKTPKNIFCQVIKMMWKCEKPKNLYKICPVYNKRKRTPCFNINISNSQNINVYVYVLSLLITLHFLGMNGKDVRAMIFSWIFLGILEKYLCYFSRKITWSLFFTYKLFQRIFSNPIKSKSIKVLL